MNKYLSLVAASLILASSTSFAAGKTDMDTKWICTINASSSDVAADKDADKQLAEKAGSAAKSFAAAAQNCRDCTKITCEAQD